MKDALTYILVGIVSILWYAFVLACLIVTLPARLLMMLIGEK